MKWVFSIICWVCAVGVCAALFVFLINWPEYMARFGAVVSTVTLALMLVGIGCANAPDKGK